MTTNFITCKDAIDNLREIGFKDQRIADELSIDIGEIGTIAESDDDILASDKMIQRKLKKFYVKEKLKREIRKYPFLGRSGASTRLKLPRPTVDAAYDDLIENGEVEFEMVDKPDWVTDPNVKKVRLHKVIK